MKSIGDYLQERDNNFNLLRFIAATMVIWSHSYALFDRRYSSDPLINYLGLGFAGLAVNIFFVISGFLIVRSWVTHENFMIYARSRCFRIFPGLIVAVLFCAFVVGPLYTNLSFTQYITHESVYKFIYTNILLYDRHPHLVGVFIENPRSAINGSLWSLWYEFVMYIVVAILGLMGLLKKKYMLPLTLAFLCFYFYLTLHPEHAKEHFSAFSHKYQRLSILFFLGGLIYFLRDQIYMKWQTLAWLSVLTWICYETAMFEFMFSILLTYLVFYLGFVPKGKIRGFNKFRDYSYGIYIYAFPVQQMLIASIDQITIVEIFIYAFFITLVLANLSTRFVEEPMMRLNKKYIKRHYDQAAKT